VRPALIIAGGGSGGHVFPAVAVAEAIEELADVDVVFCGTSRGLEARVVPARGWVLERLDVRPLRGGGTRHVVAGALAAIGATLSAFSLVRRVRPRAVLSVGGYAAGPVSLAAALMGVPLALLEPNSTVGLTNRLLAPIAVRAYIAWEEAAPAFRPSALRRHGVPLRATFAAGAPPEPRSMARVLVLGGSQGAAALNERMPRALALVSSSGRVFDIVHQTGRERDGAVRDAYAREGLAAAVVPFIDDVAAAVTDADVVVARAGAVTIAELAVIGRACVLVPFPHAADDHQARNAEALDRRGAAVCLRQEVADPPALAAAIERLLVDAGERAAMSTALRSCARPDAARDIATDLLALAGLAARPGPGASDPARPSRVPARALTPAGAAASRRA
jgi:UDP-N-acetylglucosamine--N-acetylmuramyl-(pentapeptide) pyrophosphoryl-undecaprenol N-acetylglucosamine transferase